MQEHSEPVITNEDFTALSHDALCSFLSLEKMNLDDEMKLYEAAVTWATINTTTNQQGEAACAAPSDGEIRRTLGEALFLIRLPAADMKKFANVCGNSGVLTSDEKSAIYFHGLQDNNVSDSKAGDENRMVAGFISLPRLSGSDHVITVNRFRSTYDGWNIRSTTQVLSFMVSENVNLLGVGIYGSSTPAHMDTVTLSVFDQNNQTMATVSKSDILCDGTATPIPIKLDKPIPVLPNFQYTISAVIPGVTYYGQSPTATEGVTFVQTSSRHFRRSQNCFNQGQIPTILFSK